MRQGQEDFEWDEPPPRPRGARFRIPTTFPPAPAWAPVTFWLGVACMVAFDVLFLSSYGSPSGSSAASTVLLGASFALIGWYDILDPVRVDRIAPYGHPGGASGIWLLGWFFILAGLGTAIVGAVGVLW